MGSSSSKGASSCSSSSSCSLRKNRSKRHRGFPSYCLGTTSGSRDSDNDELVCDQNKVNGSDVTYTNSNEIDSDEAKSESFKKKVKPDEIPCMPSNIDLDEWSHTESRTSSIPAHASSTQSTNSMSRFLSRFSLIPGNISFRLSRTTSLGSSRPCPDSSQSLSMFNNDDELSLHNRNQTQQYSGGNGSFVNPVPIQYHGDASNSLSSKCPDIRFG
ncbi:hypothetical protein RYX36_026914 [Vicia faba]